MYMCIILERHRESYPLRYEGEIKAAPVTGLHLARAARTEAAAGHLAPLPLPRRPHKAPGEAEERKTLRHIVHDPP